MRIINLLLVIALFFSLSLNSFASDKVQFGGNFLSVFNSLNQKDQLNNQAKKTQFDVAGNVDVTWNISEKITGAIQLQSSAGEGSLGFASNQVVLTDINLHIILSNQFALTTGSFDTPFGTQTSNLTNNADATNNPLILNSLFYSAFAGTNAGTLNTIGAMLDFNLNDFQSTLALTNGTDEGALNPDGNFEIVANIGYQFTESFFLSTSLLLSEDISASGIAGFGTNLTAMMIDCNAQPLDNLNIAAYVGQLTFDDGLTLTDDDVTILMIQGTFPISPGMHISFRSSMWTPEDDDGDGLGQSRQLVLPGFNGTFGSNTAVTDQHVNRLQLGFGYELIKNLQFKSELFLENYDKSKDIKGIILALNASF